MMEPIFGFFFYKSLELVANIDFIVVDKLKYRVSYVAVCSLSVVQMNQNYKLSISRKEKASEC